MQEKAAYDELMAERLAQAISTLTPTQARRLRAYYMDKKKIRSIAQEEDISANCVSTSITSGKKKLKDYFDRHNWKRWEDC